MLKGPVLCWLLLCVWYCSALQTQIQIKTQIQTKTTVCGSEQGINLLQKIWDKRPSWSSDTLLYTPSHLQFQRCPGFSMGCMESEMKTLLEEWTINNRTGNLILRILRAQTRTKDQEQGCVRCELLQEEPALRFLDFLKSSLQEINSRCRTTSSTPL